MNNSLNEYLRFNFELNIELNHFLARFNVKMNNQNVSATPRAEAYPLSGCNVMSRFNEASLSLTVELQDGARLVT